MRARLPIYGYLMLQQTLAGGADILGRSISGACKVWLLKARKSGELRALVLNKVDGKECAADVKMSVDQLRRYSGDAEAHYMYGSDGLQERCEARGGVRRRPARGGGGGGRGLARGGAGGARWGRGGGGDAA